MSAPVKAGAVNAAPNKGYTVNFLSAPATGYRLYFQDVGCHAVMRHLWYGSLRAAKIARGKLHLGECVIVGADGVVI